MVLPGSPGGWFETHGDQGRRRLAAPVLAVAVEVVNLAIEMTPPRPWKPALYFPVDDPRHTAGRGDGFRPPGRPTRPPEPGATGRHSGSRDRLIHPQHPQPVRALPGAPAAAMPSPYGCAAAPLGGNLSARQPWPSRP
jgi:hypothetical protein